MLVESMRDIGYSLETALADVIDNSITAGAKTIRIFVDTASRNIRIGVTDDGFGMTRAELLAAMRLGSRDPRERNRSKDLGRFGLGMKTASFSQCRRLTVVAKKDGVSCCATWDLDHVVASDEWELLVSDDVGALPYADLLGPEGVLVLWEKLDRAVEDADTELGRQHFVRRVDESRSYLELVFHRFLSGEPGRKRVQIFLNNLRLQAFDPFHSSHRATIHGQTESIQVRGVSVEITPFTLPHHRNVTRSEWEHYGGQAGYLKNQGFYLYREGRLIVFGTWFGLARQAELTKLTRVRIDMPNALDADWHVDVKKASARPPLHVRHRLQRLIGEIGAPSRRVYEQRGRVLHDSALPLWSRVQETNGIVYRVNPDTPAIADFRGSLIPSQADRFDRLCRMISSALPMDAVFADLAGSPDEVTHDRLDAGTLLELLLSTLQGLEARGVDPRYIPAMLQRTEPFRSQWEETERLLEQHLKPDS